MISQQQSPDGIPERYRPVSDECCTRSNMFTMFTMFRVVLPVAARRGIGINPSDFGSTGVVSECVNL